MNIEPYWEGKETGAPDPWGGVCEYHQCTYRECTQDGRHPVNVMGDMLWVFEFPTRPFIDRKEPVKATMNELAKKHAGHSNAAYEAAIQRLKSGEKLPKLNVERQKIDV